MRQPKQETIKDTRSKQNLSSPGPRLLSTSVHNMHNKPDSCHLSILHIVLF